MGYSLKLKIDKYYPRKDGTSAVYFQLIINRKKERIGLDITWPINKFSEKEGKLLQRFKGDPDVDVYNVVIDNGRTKAANIRKEYLLKSWTLTMDAFLREYTTDLNKNNFIEYFERKALARWSSRDIGDETYEKEKVVLRKLQAYQSVIPFSSFTPRWAKEFDKFLKAKPYNNDDNTRWGNHKIIMTYLALAREEDRIVFEDPYSKFINRAVEGSWGPITLDQMLYAFDWYIKWRDNPVPLLKRKNGVTSVDKRPELTYAEVGVLRKFLFGCNSSLRISDLNELDEHIFSEGEMSIIPHKTERYGNKIKSIPLNDIALQLLDDEIAEVKRVREKSEKLLRIFERYGDQYCNRMLKRIAAKIGWDFNLHMHMARYTFASIYDQAGVNHTSLLKMMGLKKRDTLAKYTKTNSEAIGGEVKKMNLLFTAKKIPA